MPLHVRYDRCEMLIEGNFHTSTTAFVFLKIAAGVDPDGRSIT
jgi:hypothetical protein